MKKPTNEGGPDPIDRHVGARIRARRSGLRVSQTKLGESIGVTFQQIQKYENGINRVGASNLYKIANTLGVDVSFFFDGLKLDSAAAEAGGRPGMSDVLQPTFSGDPMNSKEAYELTHNFYRIPDPKVRKNLLQLLRTLAFREEKEHLTDL